MDEFMLKVLIVDDEQYIRESFADYFEDHGWQTLIAHSGEQALEILERESPDGATVDIRLPGIDGNEFIRQALQKNSRMVFVVCTGSPEYDIPEDLLKNFRVSDDTLQKPVVNMALMERQLLRLMEHVKGQNIND